MADTIEDIKARLSVYDVVSSYVQLKKTGANYKGLCPFHSEKTPSFIVSPEKQIFHCFGCNKGGDIFTFVQELEGVDFPESVQILADRAGIKIENFSKIEKKAGKSEKEEYFKAHELACECFEKELFKSDEGKKVLEYLHKRGLKDQAIKEFHLGFAPESYEFLYPYLLKKGISKNVLLKSGFVSSKGFAEDSIYDKFRMRLMFPIFDYMGKICGFGGRALKNDQEPKYLNSPENPIYNKSKVLYGLFQAKDAIKESGEVLLVEGYFDFLLPFSAGVKNVCASCGTALTSDQARIIKRFTSKVVTCFDSDDAGFEATKRAYGVLEKEEMNVRTISFSKEKDPADFVLANGGEALSSLIKDAPDFMNFYIDKLFKEYNNETFDGRRMILSQLMPNFKNLKPVLRDMYLRELANKMGTETKVLYDELSNFELSERHPARIFSNGKENFVPKISASEIILAIVLKYPEFFEEIKDLVTVEDFSEEIKDVYKELVDQYNLTRTGEVEWKLESGFLADRRAKVDVIMLYAEDKYIGFTEEAVKVELHKLIDKIGENRRSKKLKEIQKKIVETEKNGDKEKLMELLAVQQEIMSGQS